MPIYPFERMVYPMRLGSPFLTRNAGKNGIKYPGGLIPGGDPPSNLPTADDTSRGRSRREGAAVSSGTMTPRGAVPVQQPQVAPAVSSYYPSVVGGYVPQVQQPYQQPAAPVAARPQGPDRSIISAAGGLHAIGGPGQVEKLPAETGEHSSVYFQTMLSIVGMSGGLCLQ